MPYLGARNYATPSLRNCKPRVRHRGASSLSCSECLASGAAGPRRMAGALIQEKGVERLDHRVRFVGNRKTILIVEKLRTRQSASLTGRSRVRLERPAPFPPSGVGRSLPADLRGSRTVAGTSAFGFAPRPSSQVAVRMPTPIPLTWVQKE